MGNQNIIIKRCGINSIMDKNGDLQLLIFDLVDTCRKYRATINVVLNTINLYAGQDYLLSQLSQDKGMKISILAKNMKIQMPTLSKMVQRLEKNGYVLKDKDVGDARSVAILLTEDGVKKKRQIYSIWTQIEEKTFAAFFLGEKMQLRRLLRQMSINLDNLETDTINC